MSDDNHDGFAEVINLLAAPLAGGIRAVDHFRRGAEELIKAIDNMNRTMENLNDTAVRVNRLIADLEGPIRAMVPQLVRTIETAEQITGALDAPLRAAAPNITTIAEMLSSPGFSTLPDQLGEFMKTLGDMSQRMGPLTQLAETAGGLFGGLKIPGMGDSKLANDPAASAPQKQPEARSSAGPASGSSTTPAPKSTAKKSAAPKKAAPPKKPAVKPAQKAAPKKAGSRAKPAQKRDS
jgi:hypothetical protein